MPLSLLLFLPALLASGPLKQAEAPTRPAQSAGSAGRPAPAVQIMARGKSLRAQARIPVSVEIRNGGDAALPPVPVAFTVDGGGYADWRLPKPLAPGESVTWHLTFTGSRGMHLLAATVDPFDDVPGMDRSNSSAFINVGLEEAGPPFPWLAFSFGLICFLLGAAAGALLRRPTGLRARRATAFSRKPGGASRRRSG